jgi:hypothetical protein
MLSRLALGLTLFAATGCGPAALAPLPQAPVRSAATTAAPRVQILQQVQQLVASRNPQATVRLAAADPWQELGQRNGNTLRFDVVTDLTVAGRSAAERVEFYGDFDRPSGRLVPGSLLVISDTEATYRQLVPAP